MYRSAVRTLHACIYFSYHSVVKPLHHYYITFIHSYVTPYATSLAPPRPSLLYFRTPTLTGAAVEISPELEGG